MSGHVSNRDPLQRRASSGKWSVNWTDTHNADQVTAIPLAESGTISSQNDLKTPAKRTSTRIIRTFEEIEVEKKVLQEEWYEELECGM
jgi:hypothetical protein